MLRGLLNITITNTKIVLCVWQEQIITIAIMIGILLSIGCLALEFPGDRKRRDPGNRSHDILHFFFD